MGLVCSICNKKASYKVTIDCGRFNHNFYYCPLHQPEKFSLMELDDKQVISKEIIRETKFDKLLHKNIEGVNNG